MNRLLRLTAAAVTLALVALPATASTFVAMSDVDLVKGSHAVIEGKVLRTISFWDETNSVIVTEASIEVVDRITGESVAAVVDVRTFGGEVGNYRVEAHGFPQFAAGEHVVLFLGQESNRAYSVLGYQLGHYRVERNRAGAQVAVPTLEPGVELVDLRGAVVARPARLELGALKSRLRSIERTNNDHRPAL